MAKTPNQVLEEWVLRGYVPADAPDADRGRYLSFIQQAKESILSYCNIPLAAPMPDGLFYPWVEIGWATANGATLVQGSGAVKSMTEGDTTITYDVGTTVVKGNTVTVDYSTILGRFRRLP